ncbi:hypothetical protein PoB_006164500 [Plakobranchus ocellatus]|uniref:Reverse transcriptase domain-containing protein n=1 Tax=Plakobranchus ocellatus TaxID=259542 RepID=A0AAV4CTG0_9GAST|nr:hypothetical protein PoB_006164500 [Plakobranchus ocellatus]
MSQGCVLAPIFFGLLFSAKLTHVFRDADTDINIWYKTDGSVMNLRRLQAENQGFYRSHRRTSVSSVTVLSATMQRSIDKFYEVCKKFSLRISTPKKRKMHQLAIGEPHHNR